MASSTILKLIVCCASILYDKTCYQITGDSLLQYISFRHTIVFFDNDLHVKPHGYGLMGCKVQLTELRLVSKTTFKMAFCSYPTFKKQIQPLNFSKLPRKSAICPQRSPRQLIVLKSALTQVRAIGHIGAIGQERNLLLPD